MFSIGFLTLDLIILTVVFVACVFISMTRGEHVLTRAVLITYPAMLCYTHLPYVTVRDAFANIAAFIGVFIVLHLLLKRLVTARRSYTKGKQLIDAILLALATTVTLLTLYYHVLPVEQLYSFTIPFAYLFTTTLPFGVWLVIPLVLLAFANRGSHN
ncbi:MAG: hypothetical protein RL150_363 [Candidatus Parcubacteria bacterium]|jgi:hypothetical protein